MSGIVCQVQSNLRQVRISAGLTIAELARRAGLSEKTVRRAEKGEVTTPTTLYRIFNAYNGAVPESHALVTPLAIWPEAKLS